jgi:S1-C subfamily serine protease
MNDQVFAGAPVHTEDYEGNTPQIIVPGFNAPANVSMGSYLNSGDYLNQSSNNSFDLSYSGQDIIPTLTIDKTANENDQTTYPDTSSTAELTQANSDSIVQVYGHEQGKAADEDVSGSGFFIDSQGDLSTAYHVIKNIDGPIYVDTTDGVTHKATVVKTDPASDTALLSIDAFNPTQPVSLDTGALPHGSPLLAIGHPEGWTDLYVSPGKYDDKTKLGDLASGSDLGGANPNQTMIAANMNTEPGDSGAPVFDNKGSVVGFVDRGDDGEHGYMVPSSAIIALANGTPNPGANGEGVNAGPHTTNAGDYAISAIAGFGSRLLPTTSAFRPFLGNVATGASAAMGGYDLISHDGQALVRSFEHGSTSAKIHSSLSVAADGLMIGGALTRFLPGGAKEAGLSMSLLGDTVKMLNR